MPTYDVFCSVSTCSNVVGELTTDEGAAVPTTAELKNSALCSSCTPDYQTWRIDNPAAQSSGFFGPASPAPVLFSPTSGPVGTVVTVKTIHPLCTVLFNGQQADAPLIAGSNVTVAVPGGATTGQLSVDPNASGPDGPIPPIDFGVFTVT